MSTEKYKYSFRKGQRFSLDYILRFGAMVKCDFYRILITHPRDAKVEITKDVDIEMNVTVRGGSDE